MTVEELKIEAENLGYYIVKKPDHRVKMFPCTCGAKQSIRFSMERSGLISPSRTGYMSCWRCGNTGPKVTKNDATKYDLENLAREEWNRYILSKVEKENE